jgi:hypothetical protein
MEITFQCCNKVYTFKTNDLEGDLEKLFHNFDIATVYENGGFWVRFLSPVYDLEGNVIAKGWWVRNEYW